MNRNLLFGIVFVFVLVFAAGIFLSKSSKNKTLGVSANGPVKEFTITGTNYSFTPNQITVNKGDTIKINFIDNDGVHNLVVDGYSISTKTITSGSQDSIEFVADKTGQFEYFCSVAGHREFGMTGTLTVN